MKLSLYALVLAASLAAPLRAGAQRPGEEELLYDPRENTVGALVELNAGFLPGVTVTGSGALDFFEVKTTWSSSIGFVVGYGITPSWLIYGGVDRAKPNSDNARVLGSMTLDHFDVGLRYNHHLADVRLVPYADVAFSGKQLYARQLVDTLGVARRTTINGRAVAVGAGVQYFFTENFALDGSAKVSIGSFGRVWIDGSKRQSIDSSGGTTTRFRVGVAWYPQS